MNLPIALDAESATVGAMLLSRGAVEVGLDRCAVEDFSNDRLGAVFGAIVDLYHAGAPVDPVTVSFRLAEIGHAEKGDADFVRRIQASTPASSSIRSYADTVAKYASARRAMFVGQAITDAGAAVDLDCVDDLLETADARIAAPSPDVEAATPVARFLAETEAEVRWLVRETLEVGDRLILTGAEGGGKSVWLRQLAWQMASGLHPFLGTRERRLRILHVDCENSRAQVARGYGMLAAVRPSDADLPLFVTCRPQGLDLTSRRDASWLLSLVGIHAAEVLVIGPLYKLHRAAEGSSTGEGVASATAAVFDQIRSAYGTAVLIEAHAPFGEARSDFRPFGSSLWLRWPEFGFGLKRGAPDPTQRPTVEIVEWRGKRDDTRRWPTALVRMDGAGTWPWAPIGVDVL